MFTNFKDSWFKLLIESYLQVMVIMSLCFDMTIYMFIKKEQDIFYLFIDLLC